MNHPETIPDIIFGELIHEENRVARHRRERTGVKHRHRTLPLDPEPGELIVLTVTTDGETPFDAVRCHYTTDDGDPAGPSARIVDLQPAGAEWNTVTWGYVRRWTGTLPPQPAGTMLRYHVAARVTGTERWIFADDQATSTAEATNFALWIDHDQVPAWARKALVYHVFVDRFYPGDETEWRQPDSLSGFYGGTLRGVIQKLDYIESLGCNAIWLSPIFASPSHHGYNATDYYTIERRLGTNADLHELIEAAHDRGIRIILDFVANHWSASHPTFRAAQRDRDSEYHDWYIWNEWPHDYETFFDVKELPQLNLAPGPARDYVLECAQYWLRQGIDGYRLDFAHGPPLDFWADFRRACRTVDPDCWLFGEVVHTAATQRTYAGQLDGTLDFLLAGALRRTFAQQTWSLEQFEAFLSGHESYFPPMDAFLRPSFLDNHDVNRFLFLARDDPARLKLAALVLYTLAGPPIVYNGTEVGVTQTRPIHVDGVAIMEQARRPMRWGDDRDADLLTYFRRLGELRHAYPMLQRGTRRCLHVDGEAGTYAYVREAGVERVLVALTVSERSQSIVLPKGTVNAGATDRLNGHTVRARDDSVEVILPARSGAFIA